MATALKVLLFPAYRSTDFEVHRNWLAITNTLPAQKWYYEATSQWTLDYPPFFAYFEWALSQIAALIDPEMVKVENLDYASWPTICFQRASVVVTELLLVYALHHFIYNTPLWGQKRSHAVALSVLLSPGFLIIDHIHFQYNSMMYGLLILSVSLARKDDGLLSSGVLFAILLCFKHIYLYLAPAYFVYLLRVYCLTRTDVFRVQLLNVVKLGISIVTVFALALGPFAAWGQLDSLKSRLFPFSRGLCHAYWAPNMWALYSFFDRVLIVAAPYLNLDVDSEALKSVTRGLVGDTTFAVLPNVTPPLCFSLTLAFQAIALVKLWTKPTWDTFVGALTLCGYASFLFGWHVHEKAILLVIVPFTLVALKDRSYLASFRPLAVAGHISLFPLLFTAQEFPVKVAYTTAWLILFLYSFDRLAPAPIRQRIFLLDRFTLLYNIVCVPLVVYCAGLHGLLFRDQYEFLPLMFTSTYSAVGIVTSWLGFQVCYLSS